jgi:hypothetical protein
MGSKRDYVKGFLISHQIQFMSKVKSLHYASSLYVGSPSLCYDIELKISRAVTTGKQNELCVRLHTTKLDLNL